MPISGDIFFKNPGVQSDIGGAFGQGLEMGKSLKQIRDQKALDEAYKSGTVQNPDGTVSIDRGKTLSELAKVNPQAAMEFEKKSQEQDFAKKTRQLDFIGRAHQSINDQKTYDLHLNEAKQMGLDTSMMPPQWGPEAQQVLKYYAGMALTEKDKIDRELRREQLKNDAFNRSEVRKSREFQQELVRDEKKQALQTPYGLANTTDDAKTLKDAHEMKKSFDNKLQQLITLRQNHKGGAHAWNVSDIDRGKQLSKDLLLEYKNLQKLGVLSKSDEDIINAIIPEDPLKYRTVTESLTGQDSTLNRLQSFQTDADKDFQTRVQTRTRAGLNNALKNPSGGQSTAGTKTLKTNEIDWAD